MDFEDTQVSAEQEGVVGSPADTEGIDAEAGENEQGAAAPESGEKDREAVKNKAGNEQETAAPERGAPQYTAEQQRYLDTEGQITELAERGRLEITAGNDKMRLYVQESRRGGYMAAAAQEGAAPVIFEGETREDAARQAVEYAKGERNGGQGTRAGGERTMGLGAEGSAEGLAGEAGSDQSGTEQSRRIEKINALGLQQSSAAAQGVKNGTDTVKNRFFRPGDSEAVDKLIREDAEYSTVAALCKARGQNLILFTGLLEVNESGKTILADGMQQGSDIYIRADGNEHSPLKIYEHEDTHDAIEAAGGESGALYQSMKAQLIRHLGGQQQFEALKAKYAEALPDGYSEYQIVQEMLSDARGTMNDFKGNKALKAALDEEVQRQIGERRTGRRGSGSNLSELGTDEDTESRRKQENFADMKQAVREVLQELGIGTQETQNAGDIAEYIRNGKKPDTVHLSSNGLDADTEGMNEPLETVHGSDGDYIIVPLAEGTNGDQTGNIARLARAIPELQSMKTVASISGSELDAFSNMKGTDLVRALFDRLGGSVYRDGFGEIELGKYGAKAVSTGAHHPNRFKFLALNALPEILSKGTMVFANDERHPGKLGFMFAAPVEIMGKKTYVGAVVHQMIADGQNKFYLLDMVDERGWRFGIEKDADSSMGRVPQEVVTGESVASFNAKITQKPDVVKPSKSQLNVDTDTETAVGTEIQRTQEQGRTSQEPLQDTGITDNRFTEALKKIGVNNITGSLVDYAGIEVEQQTARTAAEARRYLRRVLKETRADPRTQAFAHDVARGIYTMDDLPNTMSRGIVEELADAYRYADGVVQDSLAYKRRQINAGLDADARKLFADSDNYNPAKFGRLSKTLMNERTPARVLRSIFGEEKGSEIYEAYWRPIIENNAAAKLWKNRQREDVKEFRDSKGTIRELTEDESAYAMKVLEGLAFEEEARNAAGMDKENLDRYIANFNQLMELMPKTGYNTEADRVDDVLSGKLTRSEAAAQSTNKELFEQIMENRLATASLPELSRALQTTLDGYEAALWQMLAHGKKNPFDAEIGKEIYDDYGIWSNARKKAETEAGKVEKNP